MNNEVTNIELLMVIYKIFYNENLNLKDKNIYIKIKTMLSILNEFNNYLGIKNLSSLDIENILNKLSLFEEIPSVNNQDRLNNDTKEIIKIIGTTITKHLPNGFKGIDALIKISNLIHEDNNIATTNIKKRDKNI